MEFNLKDFIDINHKHTFYMNIDSPSTPYYIVHCATCDVELLIGWWSGKTGHRYCVENPFMHFCNKNIVDILTYSKDSLPVPGIHL